MQMFVIFVASIFSLWTTQGLIKCIYLTSVLKACYLKTIHELFDNASLYVKETYH